jgi:hypothetical protein
MATANRRDAGHVVRLDATGAFAISTGAQDQGPTILITARHQTADETLRNVV